MDLAITVVMKLVFYEARGWNCVVKQLQNIKKPLLGGLPVDYRHDFYTERRCLALNQRNYMVGAAGYL